MMFDTLPVQRVLQEEAHCGPATIKMMLDYQEVHLTQTAVSEAADMAHIIQDAGGMRLDELNQAIVELFPQGEYQLLAKYHADLADLEHLIDEFHLPVGIEWQGHFAMPDGSEADIGHYSVINGIDRAKGILSIVDPEPQNLLTQSGELTIETFLARWWEIDIVPRPDDFSITEVIEMERLLYVVVPQTDVSRLHKLGFRPATLELMWEHCMQLEKR